MFRFGLVVFVQQFLSIAVNRKKPYASHCVSVAQVLTGFKSKHYALILHVFWISICTFNPLFVAMKVLHNST